MTAATSATTQKLRTDRQSEGLRKGFWSQTVEIYFEEQD